MSNYYNYYDSNSYYDSFTPSNNMSGGALFDNDNLIMYVLLGLIIIVVVVVMRQMNDKYEKILDNMSKPKTQMIQLPVQTQNQQHPQQQLQNNEIMTQQSEDQNQQMQQGSVKINIHKVDKEVPFFPRKTAFDLWREYDYRTLNDPLVAPRRRDDFNLPVLPLPTQGYPAPYKKVGLLVDRKTHDNDRYKFLILMGRNTHPGSYHFEYYAAENDKASVLKFDVCKRGKHELQTDDKVRIGELDRTYTVVMDRILGYEYDPYLY